MSVYSIDSIAPDFADPTTNWLAPGAVVLGNVFVGRNVSIWFGAVIRGDNDRIEIGDGSNIQEHSVLHTDAGYPLTIGRGCTIGHRAMLHGCTIGESSLIGIGAILLNGARIGRNSLVGAGALVTEGKEFPDNSLIVGSPARAVRELDTAAVARLRASAEHYVANGRRFAAGLEAL